MSAACATSGGAAKVSTLLAMPAARGLFKRAILQSGAANQLGNVDSGTKLAAQVLGKLGIAETKAAKILDVPAEAILKAQFAASSAGIACA